MLGWLPSFWDELTKLSAEELSPSARAKEYLQYGALGGAMGPVIGGIGNLIQRGELAPYKVKVKRWIPAQIATGALLGGALPVMRDLLHRTNVEEAQRARQAGKLLRAMAPEGAEKALKKLQRRAGALEL